MVRRAFKRSGEAFRGSARLATPSGTDVRAVKSGTKWKWVAYDRLSISFYLPKLNPKQLEERKES
jgi:hypothetical protein